MSSKFPIPTLLLFAVLTGCSYRTTRIGYEEIENDDSDITCEVRFVRDTVSLGELSVIGSIELKETGFTVNCDEEDALQFLREEACLQGANIVHITAEKRADLLSSCYRPTATLIRTADAPAVFSHPYYSEQALTERDSSDQKRKAGMIVLSIITGFAVGFAMVTLF